ncbi:LysR family transcriptional regulator [Pusillimonas caeni]|uniref:LysR family transcriptional regulator n=1 Tax=Pusillimonas caeni TaxID=1348472 RepID=UPI000E59C031|nr:LysR family transcriptional regulator [Pusillimonas caeni]TFL14795.1 LysR family transcriptional regulator [Pusillimonas caeni]
MNLTQRQLQAFLNIARLSSFTRAAEVLHITQSGLSALIRDMEAQMNCRLFDRTTRSVSLTDAGARLLPVATRVVSELDSVSGELKELSTQARRILRVAATPLIAASVFPQARAAFQEQRPEITLQVRDIDRRQIQDEIEQGLIDVGFGIFFKPASGIERVELTSFSLVFITAAEKEFQAITEKKTWNSLGSTPLVSLPPDNPVQQLIEEHLRRLGRADENRPVHENLQTILAMVEAGFGSAILPGFVANACRRYRVDISVLVRPTVPINYYQITRKGREPIQGAHALATAVKNVLESQQRQSAGT